jgi:hypothetical protein
VVRGGAGWRDRQPSQPLIGWRLRARLTRNPLRRRQSAVERLATFGLVLFLLVLTAGVGLAAGTVAVAASARLTEAGQPKHQITAAVSDTVADPAAHPDNHTVTLSWRWNGAAHTAAEPADTMWLPTGKTTTVWVDNTGRLTPPPIQPGDTVLAAIVAGIGVTLAAAVLGWCALRMFSTWLLRHQSESWHEEWARVSPVWRRRHGWH